MCEALSQYSQFALEYVFCNLFNSQTCLLLVILSEKLLTKDTYKDVFCDFDI
jgi:hypothetical protein